MTPAPLNPVDLSLWEATAPPAPDLPPLSGAEEAEVAVVGGGILGLAVALHLAEAGVSACLLEASPGPGGGASGRSGGQVIPGLRHDPGELLARYGAERGARLDALAAGAASATFALVRRLGLDCEASPTGWVQAVDTETGLAEARRRLGWWAARGAPVSWLDRAGMAEALGTGAYLGGWRHAEGGHLQPLAYARGLARAALAAGARLCAGSPALAMAPEGAGWRIATPGGSLRARRVLVAANARDGGLWPGLERTVLPVWSFQVATPPLDALLSPEEAARILPGRPAVSDKRRVLRYWRRDAAGRLVVGGKGTLSAPRRPGQFATVRRILARLYPALAEAPLEHAWGGQVSITTDRWPRLARLGPGAWSAMLCNGQGVALTTALAPALAEMLAGGEEAACPLPAGPPEPVPFHGLRRLYVGAGSAWLRFRDALERGGAPA